MKSPEPPCPICGKPSLAKLRPFCSARCADVDLGRWMTGQYVLPGPESEADEIGALDKADGVG